MSALVVLVVLAVLLWPVGEASSSGSRTEGGRPARWSGSARWRRRVTAAKPGNALGDDSWVADLADVVVVGLDAGLDLPRAVLVAARSPTVARHAPWLEPTVHRAVASGGSVADCLGPTPDGGGPRAGSTAELELLVRAWRLSEEGGAAASATTFAAAESLRVRRAQRQRADALSAGPRASMRLLTALPLLGPVVGLLVGVDPGRMYGSVPAKVGAASGLLLTVGGWLWARRMLRRAARAARTSGAVR